jgi:ketosteroid isomerase-like protein
VGGETHTETIDMTTNPNETATEAVDRTAQEILDAFEAKDPAKARSYYAPDAVIATAGRPAARGGEAVSKAISDDIADPNFKLSLSNKKTEVARSGELAYRQGTFTITYTNPQSKTAENAAGSYLDIFRKQADGWKVVADFGV